MVAPAGTPQPIISRLHKDLTAVLKSPDIRDALLARGIDAESSTPDEFTSYIKSESAKWGKVIRAANLKSN
jgi:tripartite-type tricarboxylate transporter receptor subunit TctC